MSKLVRDNIPEIIEANGETPIIIKVSGLELRSALIDKLYEEVDEFMVAPDVDNAMEELADIMEVIRGIADTYQGADRLEEVRLAKHAKRGGFNEGIIWFGNK